jgi:hypothetical protein
MSSVNRLQSAHQSMSLAYKLLDELSDHDGVWMLRAIIEDCGSAVQGIEDKICEASQAEQKKCDDS